MWRGAAHTSAYVLEHTMAVLALHLSLAPGTHLRLGVFACLYIVLESACGAHKAQRHKFSLHVFCIMVMIRHP